MQYILDTSALRSIGTATLQAALNAGHCLLISPISAWELLSHLADENFQLARGNVRKAALCQILHDPLAEIMADVGCAAAVNPSRYEDRTGLPAIISEAVSAEAYNEMLGRRIVVDGQPRLIADLSPRILAVFGDEQAQYGDAMRARCRRLIERYGRQRAMHLDGEDFYREATDLACGLREDAVAVGCAVELDDLILRTVFGSGYSVARACQYIESNGDIEQVVPEPNDLEDYYISLHLGATSERILITDDRCILRGIRRTIATCLPFLPRRGTRDVTSRLVLTSAQFRETFAPPENQGNASEGERRIP